MNKKDVIEKLLRDSLFGLSIQQLATATKISRQTIVNLLYELKGEDKIVISIVGPAKIHSIKDKKEVRK